MAKDTKPEDQAPDENERPGDEADESSPLREELEEALREKDQFRSMAQRAQADLINFKRRAEEERDAALQGQRQEHQAPCPQGRHGGRVGCRLRLPRPPVGRHRQLRSGWREACARPPTA